jgi:uncharacterized protein DUF4157
VFGVVGEFVEDIGEEIEEGADAFVDAAQEFVDEAEAAVRAIAREAEEAWEAATNEVDQLLDEAREEMGDVLNGVADLVESGFNAVTELAEEAWEQAAGLLEAIPEAISRATELWDEIEGAIVGAATAIADGIERAWDAATGFAEDAWESIETGARAAWDAVEAAALGVAHAVVRLVDETLRLLELAIEFIGEVVTSFVQLLASLGACAAGQFVYSLAKSDALAVNFVPLQPRVRSIPNALKDSLEPLLNADFSKTVFVDNAHLPANYFKGSTDGMTFGAVDIPPIYASQIIFLRDAYDDGRQEDRELLAHELVHAAQYQRLGGELLFACAYGNGFAKSGFDYRANPLEDEAYDFTEAHASVI